MMDGVQTSRRRAPRPGLKPCPSMPACFYLLPPTDPAR